MMDNPGISFEQFIAGVLVKFDKIDSFDINMLISDFEKVKRVQVINKVDMKDMGEIKKYISVSKDGIIYFAPSYPLTIERNYIRKKVLPSLAGEIVFRYFQQFSIEDFNKSRKEKILEEKEVLVNNVNILLISDTISDYEALLEYGFHHIDYFRSIVRSSKYFSKETGELEKYHLVLIGSHMVNEKEFLEQLQKLKDCLLVEIDSNRLQNGIELSCLLNDYQNNRSWVSKESTYIDLLDRIIECLIMNRMGIKQKKYYPIRIEHQCELRIPTTKSDLKILYLDVDLDKQDTKSLTDKLGFNIEFSNENISSMENMLGDFDIIIADSNTSNKLLRLGSEVREQAIDTGRTFSLLVTYQNKHIYLFDEDNQLDIYGYGSTIHLNYIVNDGSFSTIEEMEFRHLYDKMVEYSSIEKLELLKKKSDIKGVIEASVSLYNDCLISPISDISCKDADTFDREYLIVENKEKKRQLEALELICKYDRLKSRIEEYLRYRRDGVIRKKLDNLVIVDLPDCIHIRCLYEHRPLCAMTIPKEEYSDNLREFYVQTARDGVLNDKERVGLYTRKFDSLSDVAKRPTEEQMKVIQSIEKKVDYHLSPLIENTWTKVIRREFNDTKKNTKKKGHYRKNNKKR